MRNLDEVRNNAKLSTKALFYLIEVQTGYKSKITNLEYTDLVFTATPHDLDGYVCDVTVKFYSDVSDPDGPVIGNTIAKIQNSLYPILKEMYLDGDGKLKREEDGFFNHDNFFYVKEVIYDHEREPSLEVTFDFGLNIYFYED
jgi:hypothetical protein